jgi:hypothetical protein
MDMESFFDKRETRRLGQTERLAGHPGLAIVQNPDDRRHCADRVNGRQGHVLVYENYLGTASR